MSAQKAEEYSERHESVPPFAIHVVSYRIGGRYYCNVDNVDPGANIARAEGSTREEAESLAVARGRERLGQSALRLAASGPHPSNQPH